MKYNSVTLRCLQCKSHSIVDSDVEEFVEQYSIISYRFSISGRKSAARISGVQYYTSTELKIKSMTLSNHGIYSRYRNNEDEGVHSFIEIILTR